MPVLNVYKKEVQGGEITMHLVHIEAPIILRQTQIALGTKLAVTLPLIDMIVEGVCPLLDHELHAACKVQSTRPVHVLTSSGQATGQRVDQFEMKATPYVYTRKW